VAFSAGCDGGGSHFAIIVGCQVGGMMIVDSHVHIYSFPSFKDLSKYIQTMEDAISFRTRHPEVYKCNLTELPIDNSDDLLADMDTNGVDFALVQARAGHVSNDLVATAARRHSKRMAALARVGHDQEAGGYRDDPGPTREAAPVELDRALTALGMKGVGEIFVRSLTNHVNPEKIARDLSGIMKVLEKHRVPIQFPTAWSQFPGGLFYGDPLWADEVAGHHPSVPIILTKMGRSITHYFDSTMTVAMRNTNVYLDVVGTSPEHLRFAVEKIGADRILFGTDWSTTWRWLSVPDTLHKIRLKVINDAGLSKPDREQIMWKTAASLFKLDGYLPANDR
jgi:predicted TIM-barrel fold metal-dependent hydrolase